MVNVDLIIRSRPAYPCSKIYGSYKNKAEKDLAEASKKVQKWVSYTCLINM